MRLIGEIVRLQVQSASLKVGEPPRKRYDPSPLRAVPQLLLTPDGVAGRLSDGTVLEDVHNRTHPASKNRDTNGVSVLFTGHYATMRERYGSHLTDGIAGENILVTAPGRFLEDDVAAGLVIETSDARLISLVRVIVADPCVEFSRWALRFPEDARPDRTVADAVTFLGDGLRGFYAGYDGEPVTIRLGDRLYAE